MSIVKQRWSRFKIGAMLEQKAIAMGMEGMYLDCIGAVVKARRHVSIDLARVGQGDGRGNIKSHERNIKGGVYIGREEFNSTGDETFDRIHRLQRNLDGGEEEDYYRTKGSIKSTRCDSFLRGKGAFARPTFRSPKQL